MNATDLFAIPRLKPSIQFKEADQTFAVIYDDCNSIYIKVSENVMQLVKLVNGRNNLADISELFNRESSYQITPEEVSQILIYKLGDKILQNETNIYNLTSQPSYIKCSMLLLKPLALAWITKRMKFLFSKAALIVVMVAITILLYNFQAFSFRTKIPVKNYFLIYLVLLATSTVIHELGHATACTLYKKPMKGIGVGLYMGFLPTAFADVSSIWTLNRNQRIAVNIAGIYFETLLFVMLCLGVMVLHHKEIIPLAFLVYVKCFYNLLPFYRTDGYWIISDMFGITNLYTSSAKAFSKIFQLSWMSFNEILLCIYCMLNIAGIAYFIYYVLAVKTIPTLLYESYQFFKGIILHGTINLSMITSLLMLLSFTLFTVQIIRLVSARAARSIIASKTFKSWKRIQ